MPNFNAIPWTDIHINQIGLDVVKKLEKELQLAWKSNGQISYENMLQNGV